MIEAPRHHGNLCAEAALDLVGDGEGQQEIRSAGVEVLGHGQQSGKVVGGVAQSADRQIRIEQIRVTHQHCVKKRGLIYRCAPTADEGGRRTAAELLGLLTDCRDELPVQ